ncbi:hypothetical protein QJS04_geneDACA012828 [Acorus gramineus]|uniref:Uncharacterized protein n=1 Tax=Acorus gramineus TaxID=55184 RepID=A0AAV9BHF5_ACOGR|nr:hypothetical protein QJS04_geneDACA012828 [Acorus gramineus]
MSQDGACTLDHDAYNLGHNPEKQIVWKSLHHFMHDALDWPLIRETMPVIIQWD